MPYVIESRRPDLDLVVKEMDEIEVAADGDLNYILYAYCKRHITPGYGNYKNFIGELTEAAAEIRRRLLAPYEDQKILDNGDVE